MRLKMVVWLAVLLMPLVASAESSVWGITNGEGEIFLAGSLHALRKDDYPLPDEFEIAYRSAQALVLEVEPSASRPEMLRKLLVSRGRYGDGEIIKDHLSPMVYARLAEYCASRGLSLASMEPLRPWLVVMRLTMAKIQSDGFNEDAGVDLYLSQRAEKDHKPIYGLETAEQQIDAMAAFDDDGDPLVANFLDEEESYGQTMDEIVHAWRAGNGAQLEKLTVREMRESYPDLYQTLLVRRNHRWSALIEQWITSRKRVMVVVGAAHLVGNDSIIGMLRRRGYRVEKLN